MRIKRITAVNFGGGSFSYELSPVNMVVGNNFSGKTTIEDAIRVALTGYHNRLKRTNQSVFSLAGNAMMMQVRADLDPSGIIEHTWTKNQKGEVKLVSNIPASCKVPPIMLDPQVYFSLTNEEKTKMVFREIPIEGFSWDTVLAELVAAELPAVREGVPLSKDIQVRVDTQLAMNPPMTTQVIMEGCIDSMKANRKEQSVLYKHSLAYLESLQKTRPNVTGKIEDKSGELTLIHQKIQKVKTEFYGIQRSVTVNELASARVNDLKAKLLETDKASISEKLELLELQVRGFTKQADSLKDRSGPMRLEMKLSEAKQKQLSTELEGVEDSIDSYALAIQEEAETPTCPNPECPHQKVADGFRDQSKQAVELLKKQHADLSKQLEDEVNSSDALKLDLETEENRSKERIALEVQISGLLAQKVMLQSKLQQIDRWTAELNGITSVTVESGKLPELEAELKSLKENELTLSKSQAVFVEFNTWNQRAKLTEEKSVKLAKQLESVEKMLTVLQTKQEDISTEAFNRLLEKARLFTDGILLSPLEYRNSELGRMQNGAWVPHETFSGTEKLLAYAGMCVALAQNSPMKIVLTDELGVLDEGNKKKLIYRMVELAKNGDIDMFLGADVSREPYGGLNSVNLIKL